MQRLAGECAALDPGSVDLGQVRVAPVAGGWELKVPEATLNRAWRPEVSSSISLSLGEGVAFLTYRPDSLRLSGRLALEPDGLAVVCEVAGAEVAGIPLGPEALRSLCEGIRLAFDLKSFVPTALRVNKVDVEPGYLRVLVEAGR